MIGRSGSGHSPPGNGRMPDGYLEAGFPKPGSLERVVRNRALRDELPPATCRAIHTS